LPDPVLPSQQDATPPLDAARFYFYAANVASDRDSNTRTELHFEIFFKSECNAFGPLKIGLKRVRMNPTCTLVAGPPVASELYSNEKTNYFTPKGA
jgi:hypothetical protein